MNLRRSGWRWAGDTHGEAGTPCLGQGRNGGGQELGTGHGYGFEKSLEHFWCIGGRLGGNMDCVVE